MRKTTNVVTERVEAEKFALTLPEAFLEKPKWVIDVSPSREVHVYEKTKDVEGKPSKSWYKTYLVSKKSGKEVNHNIWYRAREYVDLVDLKFELLNLSATLNVKKRVRKDELIEVDDDE